MMKYGVEFECMVRKDLGTLIYDHGTALNHKITGMWGAEGDSSVHPIETDDYDEAEWEGCEFVSTIFSKSEVPTLISEIKTILKENGNYIENAYINKTCGFHIHFSSSLIHLYNLPYGIFGLVRDSAKLKIDSPNFWRHYNRDYAKSVSELEHIRNRDRYMEFYLSESLDKGGEWRSFNMQGVDTWAKFKNRLVLGIECLEEIENFEDVNRYAIEKGIELDNEDIPSIWTQVADTEIEVPVFHNMRTESIEVPRLQLDEEAVVVPRLAEQSDDDR